jgi:glycosyltransferase involved in cell wall biosynthesis
VTQATGQTTAPSPRGVVIVSPGGWRGGGGMGTVSRTIAGYLNSMDAGPRAYILDPRGVGSAWKWPAYALVAAARMAGLRLSGKADVLHMQFSERMSFVRKGALMLLGQAMGYRAIAHHHGAELIPFFRNASGPMRAWVGFVMRRADMNIVLGRNWERFLQDEVGIDPARVRMMYNASRDLGDVERAKPAGGPFEVLMLAHLIPRKGVGEFLQAVARLRGEGLDVTATLAGNGEIERYRGEAAALRIAEACRFTGLVGADEVARMLGRADALALPSYEEGLPMAILEALSARTTVVATPVGSIPEVLTDGTDCRLVPPGDVDALAAAIGGIARDDGVRARLAAAGRTLFERRFRLDTYMAEMLRLYAAALAR